MTTQRNLPRGGRTARRSAALGMSLIEVMVSLVIFSVGVLGLVRLQAHAIQVDTQAGDRNRAADLANEVVTLMWTNQTSDLSKDALKAWNARVADTAHGGLPSGKGVVSAKEGVATVTITWHPPWRAATEPDQTYLTQVAIP
ncbi:prepilin-type N-terminal cleavage/methylation domain-containing protein [Hydrogenophaga taeniospiralis]|jgi:type IV pilus assembly protein PilV|nr:prepilin-type N-terminal cleavage/methylation domain-containing protein [Hydrogenophaga taeniospiralis]